MKIAIRMTTLTAAVVGILVPFSAMAELSANVGMTSEYYYRGILQKDASASAGVDLEEGGFYAGAWAADVGDGLEVDGYLGYGIETESGFSAGAGFTGYYYTGEFDDTYEEVNLNLGFGPASLEYSVGTWDGFGEEADYDFLALTLSNTKDFTVNTGPLGMNLMATTSNLAMVPKLVVSTLGYRPLSSVVTNYQISSIRRVIPTESEAIVFTISKSFSF